VPVGREVVVMDKGAGLIVSNKVALAKLWLGVAESVTVTTTLAFCTTAVGVPLITPVVELIARPPGNPVAVYI
jgi:hypothetical protein